MPFVPAVSLVQLVVSCHYMCMTYFWLSSLSFVCFTFLLIHFGVLRVWARRLPPWKQTCFPKESGKEGFFLP